MPEKLIEAEFTEVTEVTEVTEGAEVGDSQLLEHLEMEDLRNVRLQLSAGLGQRRMRVREVLALKLGSIITLDKMAGELTDISINGLPLARGEIVVISDVLHVRVSEVLDGSELQGYDNA